MKGSSYDGPLSLPVPTSCSCALRPSIFSLFAGSSTIALISAMISFASSSSIVLGPAAATFASASDDDDGGGGGNPLISHCQQKHWSRGPLPPPQSSAPHTHTHTHTRVCARTGGASAAPEHRAFSVLLYICLHNIHIHEIVSLNYSIINTNYTKYTHSGYFPQRWNRENIPRLFVVLRPREQHGGTREASLRRAFVGKQRLFRTRARRNAEIRGRRVTHTRRVVNGRMCARGRGR